MIQVRCSQGSTVRELLVIAFGRIVEYLQQDRTPISEVKISETEAAVEWQLLEEATWKTLSQGSFYLVTRIVDWESYVLIQAPSGEVRQIDDVGALNDPHFWVWIHEKIGL